MKTYSITDIIIKYNKLSSIQRVKILWDALDYMSQYNGRSKYVCIAYAMGYYNDENKYDVYIKD